MAGLRSEVIRARRLWRNRGRNGRRPNVLDELEEDYRRKKDLRKAIFARQRQKHGQLSFGRLMRTYGVFHIAS